MAKNYRFPKRPENFKLPESGMGYQVVDIHLKDGTVVRNVVVVGCDQIVNPVNFSETDIVDIAMSL